MNNSMSGCDSPSIARDTILPIEAIVNAVTLAFVVVIALLGNALVIAAICTKRALRTRANVLILSLSFTDLLSPVFRVVWIELALVKGRWVLGCKWCRLSTCLGTALCSASILHLIVISVERMLVIKYPQLHSRYITRTSLMICLVCVWVTSLFMGVMPYFGIVKLQFSAHLLSCEVDLSAKPELSVLLALVYFLLPFLIIVFVYARIFASVKYQTHQLSINSYGSREERHRLMLRREWRAVKVVLVVVGVFFVLWLPYFCLNIAYSYVPRGTLPGWTMRLVWTLAYTNSCCNWVVYGALNKPIRKAFKQIIANVCKCAKYEKLLRRRNAKVSNKHNLPKRKNGRKSSISKCECFNLPLKTLNTKVYEMSTNTDKEKDNHHTENTINFQFTNSNYLHEL